MKMATQNVVEKLMGKIIKATARGQIFSLRFSTMINFQVNIKFPFLVLLKLKEPTNVCSHLYLIERNNLKTRSNLILI